MYMVSETDMQILLYFNRYVQCPYIMRLLDTAKDEVCLYFYLEPVLGGPLHSHMRRFPGGYLDEDTVSIYTAELLLALSHMYHKGCVHRDIKASNCILNQDGHIKLCDFSSAKILDESSIPLPDKQGKTYTLIGTIEFMSPEMLLRVGYSYGTDVWSTGVYVCTHQRYGDIT